MSTTDPILWHVYHSLWGKATNAPGYWKGDWNDLYREAYNHQHTRWDCHLRQEMVRMARVQGVSEEEIQKSLMG